MYKREGFTFIELLIALTITAFLLVLTIPSLSAYLANAKINNLASEIVAALQQTKSEAIHRDAPAQFTMAGTGWTITIPAIGGTPAVTVATRTATSSESVLVITPANASIGFNSLGQTSPTATLNLTITPTAAQGTCQSAGGLLRCLNVTVNAGGQVRMCDPVLPTTDPRGC